MKIKVLKPTLVQDKDGLSCIATTGMVVEVDDNRGRHFINSHRALLAKPSDKLSKLQNYQASAPARQASEAAEVGKAIADAIREGNKPELAPAPEPKTEPEPETQVITTDDVGEMPSGIFVEEDKPKKAKKAKKAKKVAADVETD